jgi:hypothetical protein
MLKILCIQFYGLNTNMQGAEMPGNLVLKEGRALCLSGPVAHVHIQVEHFENRKRKKI